MKLKEVLGGIDRYLRFSERDVGCESVKAYMQE